MELEVTKFNTRTLSTPIFVTKRTRFCPKKNRISTTTLNDKKSAILIVRYDKKYFQAGFREHEIVVHKENKMSL